MSLFLLSSSTIALAEPMPAASAQPSKGFSEGESLRDLERRQRVAAPPPSASAAPASPAAPGIGGDHMKVSIGAVIGEATVVPDGKLSLSVRDHYAQGLPSSEHANLQGANLLYDPFTGHVTVAAKVWVRGELPDERYLATKSYAGTVSRGLSPTQLVMKLKLEDGDTWEAMRLRPTAGPQGLAHVSTVDPRPSAPMLSRDPVSVAMGDVKGRARLSPGGKMHLSLEDKGWAGQSAGVSYDPATGKVIVSAEVFSYSRDPKTDILGKQLVTKRYTGKIAAGLSPEKVVASLRLHDGDTWEGMREFESQGPAGLTRHRGLLSDRQTAQRISDETPPGANTLARRGVKARLAGFGASIGKLLRAR